MRMAAMTMIGADLKKPEPEMAHTDRSAGGSGAKGNALQACGHTTRANMRGSGEMEPAEGIARSMK